MKFGNILKKELRELLTVQTILSMLVVFFVYAFMGKAMGGAINDAVTSGESMTVINLDGSDFTARMLDSLPDYGFTPQISELESENYFTEMERLGTESMIVIPAGFGESAQKGGGAEVEVYTLMNKGGFGSALTGSHAFSGVYAIESYVSDSFQNDVLGLSEEEKAYLSEPVVTAEYVCANGRTENISAESLMSVMMSQSILAPAAVFFLLMMAAQMLMTAISTEKIDKTLETLLSAPVSRLTVLCAKMTAALAVALLNAGFMIGGMMIYMSSMMSSAMSDISASGEAGEAITAAEAAASLGLTLTAGETAVYGLMIFLSIAIGLAISLILGAMATDIKSVQTLLTPVMMLTMVPFLVTVLTDINALPTAFRVILYLIPFTHTYTAMTNLVFGNTGLVWAGVAYQLLFFAVCMYLAVKVFTSDLLFTMSFSVNSPKKKSKSTRNKGLQTEDREQ